MWKKKKSAVILSDHQTKMLKSEETSAFLENAQKFSAEWTAQAQFVRDHFLPQLQAHNQQISDRLVVPAVS
jgi:hypothetical protein